MSLRFGVSVGLVAGLIWASPPASVDFVHLSDTHITMLEGVHPDITATLGTKKSASQNFRSALRRMAEGAPPAFALITGDLVDAHHFEGASGQSVAGQIEAFVKIVDSSRVPIMPVLGNHDLTSYKPAPSKLAASQAVAGESRRAWSRALAPFRAGTYYTFRREVGRTPYLFIVLDDGEAANLDPGYSAGQIRWLKDQLASHRSGPIIVAMHIPLQQAPYGKEIRAALDAAPNLALAIAGHRHSDGIETVELGERKVTQVRTAALFLSDANLRRIRLLEDRIEIFATGKPEEKVATVTLAPMAIPAGARQ